MISKYALLDAGIRPRTLHVVGLPSDVDPDGPRVALPTARLVVLNLDDPYLINRYSAKGEVVGDTWHRTEEEATEQVEFEYERGFPGWIDVPEGWREDEQGFVRMILELGEGP